MENMTSTKQTAHNMNENSKSYYKNPKIDLLFGYVGATIPSKKEDFKPIQVFEVYDSGKETILENFYTKKPSSQSVRDFEDLVRKQLLSYYHDFKIPKPRLVEVVITVYLSRSKFFDIDLDNIAKTVLDSLTGYLFEDDSQVVNLICRKEIHPKKMQGFFIAVTEFKEGRGLLWNIHLFSEKNNW